MTDSGSSLLLVLGVVGAALAAGAVLFAPTHYLIGLAFIAQFHQRSIDIAGVRLDSIDVTLFLVAISIAIRGLPRGATRIRMPYLFPWLCLVALLIAAYSVSPNGERDMTDPFRIAYQFYRYGLRWVIFYPVGWYLVNRGTKCDDVLAAIIIAADLFALMCFKQGYTGDKVTGPFGTKNELASVLAVPTTLVLSDLLSRRKPSWLILISAPILVRGILFASSRGAFAGIMAGTAAAWWFMHQGRVKTRAGQLALAGVAVLVLALLVKPDLLYRPNIARLFTTVDVKQDNFVWRIQQRWPHFIHRTLERPWLGWGDNVDLTLGKDTNTPHDGYLSLAVMFGIPVLVFYLYFAAVMVLGAWSASSRCRDPVDRIRAARIGGGLVCLLTHNIVDTVITLPFVVAELWLFAAIVVRLAGPGWDAVARRVPAASRRPAMALGTGR